MNTNTIPSYDLQEIPPNYDNLDYTFVHAPIVITHKVFVCGKAIVINLNGDLSDDDLSELQGRIDDLTTEFCNEKSEELEAEFCGF